MSCIGQTMPHIWRVSCQKRVGVMMSILGCEDTDSVFDVSCRVYMLPYILDVVSYIEAVMSLVQYCDDIRIGSDVLYSACDVTQKLGVMAFKSGCDISGEVVMTKTQWVQCLIQGV